MGLYYTLPNGEEIEIRIEENEDCTQEVHILLFGGSTTLFYPLDKTQSLNTIIEDVNRQYNKLQSEDSAFAYRCYVD